MPITYDIDKGRRRLVAVATGAVTYPDVLAHLDMERLDGGLLLHELIDATNATVDLARSPKERR